MSIDRSVLALCLVNLGVVALLPRLFFKPGRFNAQWWLTASPYVVAGVAVLAGLAGLARPWGAGWGWLGLASLLEGAGTLTATLLAAGSLWLIGFTLGAHTQPVSLWHQEDDVPEGIVQHGPYRWVRHPFYAAFLTALLACFVAFPHALTAGALVFGLVQMNRTAAREERRLARSRHGEEYRAYMKRTGRFVPW